MLEKNKATFETCNSGHNILELDDIVTNFSFAATETECDISNTNCIHEVPNEFPNDLRGFCVVGRAPWESSSTLMDATNRNRAALTVS